MAVDLMKRMEFFAHIARDRAQNAASLSAAFALLYRYYNAQTGRCDPGQTALARETAVSGRHLKRAIRMLEGRWFEVRRGSGTACRQGNTTAYRPMFESISEGVPNSSPVTGPAPVTEPSPVTDRVGEGVTNSSPRTSKSIDEPVTVRAAQAPEDSANGFETFWRIFPNRKPHPNPKKPARLKFEAAIKRGVLASEILEGARRYSAYVAQHEPNPRFWKQAVTWISQEGWTDTHEPPEERPLVVGMN